MKNLAPILFVLLFFSALTAYSSNDDQYFQMALKQSTIEDEARALIKQEKYRAALDKAQESIEMNKEFKKINGSGSGIGHFLFREVLTIQGKYEAALENINKLLKINIGQPSYIDQKLELEALIKARDTGTPKPIYEHIDYLKKKYKKWLPPKGFVSGQSEIVQVTIIRLYDHIGDYESGIKFIDQILKYALRKQSKKIRENKSASLAYQGSQDSSLEKSDQRAYKLAYEFLVIREAFEADKKENRSNCINVKPRQNEGGQASEVCMGRATKALIQSDYFPW